MTGLKTLTPRDHSCVRRSRHVSPFFRLPSRAISSPVSFFIVIKAPYATYTMYIQVNASNTINYTDDHVQRELQWFFHSCEFEIFEGVLGAFFRRKPSDSGHSRVMCLTGSRERRRAFRVRTRLLNTDVNGFGEGDILRIFVRPRLFFFIGQVLSLSRVQNVLTLCPFALRSRCRE